MTMLMVTMHASSGQLRRGKRNCVPVKQPSGKTPIRLTDMADRVYSCKLLCKNCWVVWETHSATLGWAEAPRGQKTPRPHTVPWKLSDKTRHTWVGGFVREHEDRQMMHDEEEPMMKKNPPAIFPPEQLWLWPLRKCPGTSKQRALGTALQGPAQACVSVIDIN